MFRLETAETLNTAIATVHIKYSHRYSSHEIQVVGAFEIEYNLKPSDPVNLLRVKGTRYGLDRINQIR